MAYLHLPEQHTTDDLVLAGQVAEAFKSRDLFVAWTHDAGAGACPSVRAVVREPARNPVVRVLHALLAAVARAWRGVTRPASARPVDRARTERQTV